VALLHHAVALWGRGAAASAPGVGQELFEGQVQLQQ
jgi:hypothetical protein